MLGFVITTLIFIFGILAISKISDYEEVKSNWAKYRCRIDVMMMADYYGHNSGENLGFCLKEAFDGRAKEALGPFYVYIGKFVSVLMTMLSSLNSIRMIFATIVGSATQIFSEFSERIQALFNRFQMSAIRMKMLMGRVFATMYAIIFMGMSGLKGMSNLGNTFLFKFLDTFCFDPDTPIEMHCGKSLRIQDVKIGDILKGGHRVTATFQFAADGQEMVRLPRQSRESINSDDILVSTNHYILHNSRWILSKDHPLSIPTDSWMGGEKRPLICLNTHTHQIPIGDYIFRDYDETSEGDSAAMALATTMLNGGNYTKENEKPSINSEMACHPKTLLKAKDAKHAKHAKHTLIPASEVILGTELSHGTVVGIVKKECTEVCEINGDILASGTCIWSEEQNIWTRAMFVKEPLKIPPTEFYSFVVTPSACIETSSGTVFRDYVEVHSKDLESPYSNSLAIGLGLGLGLGLPLERCENSPIETS
jgi:hypothetical protein